ncbi:MAG TPA: 30S ribosomal protein S2 [Candidatus Humimicrobiaceae bacterium]|nr:30S ribosomal protein S2 [Candidatus Humimicrobiaceae bacterium]
MATGVSLEKLIEAGAHFGHQVKRWNPRMKPYLYGVQGNVHIFDLVKTKECLDEALNVIKEAAKAGKSILIVGTKKQVKEKVSQIALETGTFYVNERWLGGTLTNFDQIKVSIQKLLDMRQKVDTGEYNKFTKKERLLIEREIARLERFFGGIKNLSSIPDLLIIIDTKKEKGAVREANFRGVETIGIVDSNSDPDLVDWPIPMNDDAIKALYYVLDLIKDAILKGKAKIVKESKNPKT